MTRAEAIRQALENLQVIDAISNPSAEDSEAVGRRLDQVRAALLEKGLCWWDEGAIPDSVAAAFCRLVAQNSADMFGKAYDPGRAVAAIAAMKSPDERPVTKTLYY